jgi:hypothetical protein
MATRESFMTSEVTPTGPVPPHATTLVETCGITVPDVVAHEIAPTIPRNAAQRMALRHIGPGGGTNSLRMCSSIGGWRVADSGTLSYCPMTMGQSSSASPARPVADVLVGRFIERSQRFRRAGAIVGILGMLCALIVATAGGDEGIELNLTLFASIGLAGSIGGSILAEGFRMRRSGPRIVSLDVRDPDVYRDQVADRRERVLLVLAAVGFVGAAITGEHLVRVVGLGAVMVAIAVIRPWVMRRISLRSRPVVPAEVAAADDEVRRLASSSGTSRPMMTLGALAVSAQWAAVASSGPTWPRPLRWCRSWLGWGRSCSSSRPAGGGGRIDHLA